MDLAVAEKLCKKLETAKGVPDHVFAGVDEDNVHIFFYSELTGVHYLSLADSDRARVLNHWKGSLANQPKEGK